jgi:hypothetical protein
MTLDIKATFASLPNGKAQIESITINKDGGIITFKIPEYIIALSRLDHSGQDNEIPKKWENLVFSAALEAVGDRALGGGHINSDNKTCSVNIHDHETVQKLFTEGPKFILEKFHNELVNATTDERKMASAIYGCNLKAIAPPK